MIIKRQNCLELLSGLVTLPATCGYIITFFENLAFKAIIAPSQNCTFCHLYSALLWWGTCGISFCNMSRFKVFVSRLQIKRPCLFVIFRTCDSKKRIPLSADYPELCPALENAPDNNAAQYCIGPRMNKWRPEKLNKTIAKEIEYQIHNYARFV